MCIYTLYSNDHGFSLVHKTAYKKIDLKILRKPRTLVTAQIGLQSCTLVTKQING